MSPRTRTHLQVWERQARLVRGVGKEHRHGQSARKAIKGVLLSKLPLWALGDNPTAEVWEMGRLRTSDSPTWGRRSQCIYLSTFLHHWLGEPLKRDNSLVLPDCPASGLCRPLLLQKKSSDKTLQMLPTVNQPESKPCKDLKDVYEASTVSVIYLAVFLLTSIPEIIKRWRHPFLLTHYVTWFFTSIIGVACTKMQPQ